MDGIRVTAGCLGGAWRQLFKFLKLELGAGRQIGTASGGIRTREQGRQEGLPVMFWQARVYDSGRSGHCDDEISPRLQRPSLHK